MSVYDIADHPDFRFRTTDIVIRIGNTEDGAPHKEDEVGRPALPLQYLSVPPGGLGVRPAPCRASCRPHRVLRAAPQAPRVISQGCTAPCSVP